MKKFFFLLFLFFQIQFSFTQSKIEDIKRYNDKSVLAQDIINAILKKDILKLKNIQDALTMPYSEFESVILPSYRNQELKKNKQNTGVKIHPNSILSNDSTIYNNVASNFYFSTLTNSILNDNDNEYLNNNIYYSYEISDKTYSNNVSINQLDIILETKNYIKYISFKELITFNNTLYCIQKSTFESIEKNTVQSKFILNRSFIKLFFKKENKEFVPYNKELLSFENVAYNESDKYDYDSPMPEKREDNSDINLNTSYTKPNETVKDTTILDRSEEMPSFQNGTKGLNKFLKENLRYPKEALKKKIEGNIIVRLMIDKDGSVKDPIILKDNLGAGCAEEALRLVQKMPKWWPGKEKGKAVKVYYTLPISFTIPK